ncbi:MAG: hypothetical protein NTY98_18500 [Verrucomicrobia bacterium]|nr:hypothetical protein [Verrucomicrobiota bacterium]
MIQLQGDYMKTAAFIFLCIASSALAQVGATIEAIAVRNSGGSEVIYAHCKAIKIEPDGVRITHDGGFAKVPLQFLPEAWKAVIPVDESAIKEFQEKQKLDAAKYAEWANEERRKLEEKEAAKKQSAAKGSTSKRPAVSRNGWVDPALKDKGAEVLMVEVMNVLPDGILANVLEEKQTVSASGMASVGGGGGVSGSVYYGLSGKSVMLKGALPKGLIDGDRFKVQALRAGTYAYTAVNGASRTVAAYDALHHDRSKP